MTDANGQVLLACLEAGALSSSFSPLGISSKVKGVGIAQLYASLDELVRTGKLVREGTQYRLTLSGALFGRSVHKVAPVPQVPSVTVVALSVPEVSDFGCPCCGYLKSTSSLTYKKYALRTCTMCMTKYVVLLGKLVKVFVTELEIEVKLQPHPRQGLPAWTESSQEVVK